LKLREIHAIIGGEILNENDTVSIQGVNILDRATPSDVVFIFNTPPKNIQTNAQVIVTKHQLSNNKLCQIIHPQPRLAMAMVLQTIYPMPTQNIRHQISESACIHPNATVHGPVSIGPFVHIDEGAIIRKNTIIHSHVAIGRECDIGERCILYSNVSIYNHTTLGSGCILHSGTVVGADGFGYEKNQSSWEKIPHIGNVIVGNDVEIGSNTSIDRGCLSDTIIGNGVKIDNQVQIAHNCTIGDHTVIVSGTLIGGSVTIGEGCTIAGNVGISDNVTIGQNVTILGQSGVTKSIDSGKTVSGFPADDHKKILKRRALQNKLLNRTIENNN